MFKSIISDVNRFLKFYRQIRLYNKLKKEESKVQNNKIVFTNFVNKGYGCNPKYIAEEIIKQHNNKYDLVWFVKNPKKESQFFPKEIRLVKYSSHQALKELRTAKFIISNYRLNYFIMKGFKKKDNQIYIQTWHGGGGVKKIEKDIEHKHPFSYYFYFAKKDSKMINYLISPSKMDSDVLKECFYFNGRILNTGYPRNDLFFLEKNSMREKINQIKNKLQIPLNKKIILYAPTFRDKKNLKVYDLNFDNVRNEFNKKFNSDFIVALRLHPSMSNLGSKFTNNFSDLIDVSKYPDPQELLLISDILITDYSSLLYDYMSLKRPIFIYAADIDDYYKERGFYFDVKKGPFIISYSKEEFINSIRDFNSDEYQKKLEIFTSERCNFDDGKASQRILDIINKKSKVLDNASNKVSISFKNLSFSYYDYLKRFLYVFDDIDKIEDETKKDYPFTIWQMWWQGEEKAPKLVKKCFESVKKFYPNNRVVITEKNYKNYIDIPDFIVEKFKKGQIGMAFFSDITRIFLLYKYGGVWVDSTCYMTDKIPDEIINSQIFYFRNTAWSKCSKIPCEQMAKNIANVSLHKSTIHTGSSWFIASKPNNRMLKIIKYLIIEYLDKHNYLINYFLIHLLFSLVVLNDEESGADFKNMPYFSNIYPHILQFSLSQNYDGKLFDDIKSYSFVHKLTYKNIGKAKRNKNSVYNYLTKNC